MRGEAHERGKGKNRLAEGTASRDDEVLFRGCHTPKETRAVRNAPIRKK